MYNQNQCLKKPFRLFYTLLFLLVFQVQSYATLYYVKPTATGAGDGTSWANASANLQSIIDGASTGDQIWVAAGSYTPLARTSGPSTYYSFTTKNGVEMYGGFVGTETLLSQRNYELNETKLVGNGNVVIKVNSSTTTNTRLDGFSITNGSSSSNDVSGGLDILGFNLTMTIQHCKFYNNTSNSTSGGGGAIAISLNSHPLIIDCSFYNNTALNGGAIYITYYSSPDIVNCSFSNNTATSGSGGAIYLASSVSAGNISKISNSVLYNNGSNEIYEATAGYLTVQYSNVKGGYVGTGNINSDPKFINAATGNLKLAYNSPSVQSGDNTIYNTLADINTSLDLAGKTRLSVNIIGTGANIDMGAYQYIVTAPSNLSYTSPNFLTVNVSTVTLTSTVSGTPTSAYLIDKTLPTGLYFNTITGVITGTPSQIFSPTSYTVTTSNIAGTATGTVHITVNDKLPNLTYTSPVSYLIGETVAPTLSPVNSGGAVTGGLNPNYSSETLNFTGAVGAVMDNVGNIYIVSETTNSIYKRTPAGATTVFATGIIGPNAITIDLSNNLYVSCDYWVYKINTSGVVTTLCSTIDIGGIIYGNDGYLYLAGNRYDNIVKIDPSTGVQTVFASNLSPSLLTYTGPTSLIFNKEGDLVVFNGDATISKVSSLGAVTQNAIITDASQKSILDAPKDVTMDAEGNLYIASGRTSVLKINTIGDIISFVDIPNGLHVLTGILFGSNGELYVLNRNIGTNNSILNTFVSGKYQIQPNLPSGLTFDMNTGDISGTTAAISQATNYTISATNSAGTFTTTLNLEVKGTLTYTSPNVFTKGVAIASLLPQTSGAVSANTFSITPTLPSGITINTATGEISGTSTVVSPSTDYIVSAIATGGSLTGKLTITVNDIPPSNLSYTTPNTYTKGTAIANLTPTVSGGAVISYSISPALPTGLSINAISGVISGTPTVISPSSTYTITASNSGGTTTKIIQIRVNDIPPSGLSYTSPNIFIKGTTIVSLAPTIGGGAVTSYSINPSLPAGLTLNASNGIISGKPTVVAATATYIIDAINSGGAVLASVVITVNDIAPSNLTYSTPNIFYKDQSITSLTPTVSGGNVVNYGINPSLPAGLTIDAISGIISGTPTTLLAASNYTVTATNSGGTTTASLNIKVMLFLFIKDTILSHNNCLNDSSGVIAVFPNGGYPPYSYSINAGPYKAIGIFDKLKSGIYTLTLRDSTGATMSVIDTIKTLSNTPLSISVSKKNNICFGENTGLILIDSISGGVVPYAFAWNTGDTLSSGLNNLVKGEYALKVTDFYGCKDSIKVTIAEPAKIIPSIVSVSPLCFNQCNGTITSAATGGSGQLNYSWNNGSILSAVNNLCAGTYTLTIRDSAGCTNTSSIVLTNPSLFKINLDSVVTICKNQTLKKDISDLQFPNATYSWASSNGFVSTSAKVSITNAGNYFVTAKTINGCTATDTLIVKVENAAIESVFAVATNVFKNDTIHIVNISNPRPNQSIWTIPSDTSVKLIYSNQDSLRIRFNTVGNYAIKLNTKLGGCVDSSIQTINVLEPSGIVIYNSSAIRLNSIQDLNVSPNPSNGRFVVSLNLQSSSAIALRILNVSTGRLEFSQRYGPEKNFTIPINLVLAADMYVLLVETEFGATAVYKIIIL